MASEGWSRPAALPDDIQVLRRGIRDLAALSTLPAIWINHSVRQIGESMAEALVAILRPEFVYIALPEDAELPTVEVTRTSGRRGPDQTAAIGPLIKEAMAHLSFHRTAEIADPAGSGTIRIASTPIGIDEDATLVVGSCQASFPNEMQRLLLGVAANQMAVALQRWRAEQALRAQTAILERVGRINQSLAAELDLKKLLQAVTDMATELSRAEFGAFFYNLVDEHDESHRLYALSGAPRESFAGLPLPRSTSLLGSTFRGEGILRSDDITADARYGRNAPYFGMPKGHPPVRSYLAVPVISRSGRVLGGLFFGHGQAGVFTESTERIVGGIAAQAATAIDNARLYADAQREIAERKQAEDHQRLLLHELSHRVKNMLAVVQSIAHQTLRRARTPEDFADSFMGRLNTLAAAHALLTQSKWRSARLHKLIQRTLKAHGTGAAAVEIGGPDIVLSPRQTLGLSLVLHELATNAAKYGALSHASGRVSVRWTIEGADAQDQLCLEWIETGGPPVSPPDNEGFGTTLIRRTLEYDLDGSAELSFEPAGLRCRVLLPWAEDASPSLP